MGDRMIVHVNLHREGGSPGFRSEVFTKVSDIIENAGRLVIRHHGEDEIFDPHQWQDLHVLEEVDYEAAKRGGRTYPAIPTPSRCTWAKAFKGESEDGVGAPVTVVTRCKKPMNGHGQEHCGRGLDQFPAWEFYWFKGDKTEFVTERTDFYAWVQEEGVSDVKPADPDSADQAE